MSWFTTTHWTVVLNAGAEDSLLAAGAIEQLCQTYWQPVHTFIRSRSQRSAEPDDLTQQFFARFLEKQHYRLADRERGRFRAFLLTSVKNFLVNEWERAAAQKRGGGQLPVSLEETMPGEDVPRLQLVDERNAEQSFEQNWALTVLARAREKLMAEYHADGRAERFVHLEQLLPGQETDMTYAQVAELLGVAEGTIKSDIHRLKRRYRELLRDEVAHTVATPGDIDAELRHLLTVVSRPRTV
jgi:RNA polymerase sigma-70 factor (ECF subfamily)